MLCGRLCFRLLFLRSFLISNRFGSSLLISSLFGRFLRLFLLFVRGLRIIFALFGLLNVLFFLLRLFGLSFGLLTLFFRCSVSLGLLGSLILLMLRLELGILGLKVLEDGLLSELMRRLALFHHLFKLDSVHCPVAIVRVYCHPRWPFVFFFFSCPCGITLYQDRANG